MNSLFSLCLVLATLVCATSSATIGSYSGDMTYYDPGVGFGSCGNRNADSEMVMAASALQMSKEYCGCSANVCRGATCVTATVVDTCPGCVHGAIDVSSAVFRALADMDLGRVKVTWTLSCGGSTVPATAPAVASPAPATTSDASTSSLAVIAPASKVSGAGSPSPIVVVAPETIVSKQVATGTIPSAGVTNPRLVTGKCWKRSD